MTEDAIVTPIHILVVDDEPDLETLLCQRFRKQIRSGAFVFHFAGDGQQALDTLDRENKIEIVLTDINMPRMDGLTLLGHLNELDRIHKSVVVSAYGDMENIRTAMNRGAFDFLTKPIDFADLDLTLSKTCRELDHMRKGAEAQRNLLSMEQELTVAARIQKSILPCQFPDSQAVDLFAIMQPAKQVSGDFYDFFMLNEDQLAFVVADVAGKGIPAALFMAVSRTLLRAVAASLPCPGQCLTRVNKLIEAENSSNLFVTMVYGVLNLKTGELRYANAGHNLPYLMKGNKIEALPNQGGVVLGVLPNVSYDATTVTLLPGQKILLYTDGVTEAMNINRGMYSEERLEALLIDNEQLDMKSLVERITEDVYTFAGEASQHDDITLMGLRFNGF